MIVDTNRPSCRTLIVVLDAPDYTLKQKLLITTDTNPYLRIKTDDYKAHTSCITEAERYEKTVYRGPKKNETTNRKLTPQERWMETIRESLETAPPALKPHLEQIVDLDNVPRKEKQFRNFASNSLRLHGRSCDSVLAAIWKHIDGVKQDVISRKAKVEAELKAEADKTSQKKQREKDDGRQGVSTVITDSEITDSSSGEGKNKEDSKPIVDQKIFKKTMTKVLKKAPNRKLKMKELRKILLKNSKVDKSTMKKLMLQIITENSRKMSLEGKTVTLISKPISS